MPANLFTTAEVLSAKDSKAKKAAKKTYVEIEGLELYGAIDHAIKWLKTQAETIKETVVEAALTKFIADGAKVEKKPDNFDAEEGKTKANIQLRKRSANSGLTDGEQALCTEYGIPVETISDRPETLIINPEHLDWVMKNSQKLSAAINKVPGAPENLFLKQEATTKVVTTDETLDVVFKKFAKKQELLAQLLPVVGTLAVKPRFDSADDAANDKALNTIFQSFFGEKEEA